MPPFRNKRSTAELASRDWSEFKLRLTQLRVLRALVDDEGEYAILSRVKLAERAGFSPISGTINSSLNGVPEGSSSGPARPGLLILGMVRKFELDIDGLVETVYQITDKGMEALKASIASTKLPPLRSRETSTNRRYRENP